ncbi:BrnA antitoxin family protein [Asticcacaulis sp. EMRT-3]|uniref:BrnA antitoxin family protein n=1 Tax=Asticcacaulis sp. EMRT-3 TaxID=3040349 RepID=UPI0024AFC774|nr:BrnA antitoxin family protein [Asticcacaulis sp. EMRT-3]MDI7775934.1 BrnA antitoxin family protein [Asticcacaulis sp. EMRT-3]
MTKSGIKTASLEDIEAMYERGELFHDPDAPEGEPLGADFWASAKIQEPKKPRSIHLKLDPEVFDFFVAETNGKGHLTRMQDVLKAYMNARKAG